MKKTKLPINLIRGKKKNAQPQLQRGWNENQYTGGVGHKKRRGGGFWYNPSPPPHENLLKSKKKHKSQYPFKEDLGG